MKTQTLKATNPTEYATLSLKGFVAWRWRVGGGGDGGQEGEVGGEKGGEGEKVYILVGGKGGTGRVGTERNEGG